MKLNDMINSMNDALESRDDEKRARITQAFYTKLIEEEEDEVVKECLINIRDCQVKIYLEQKRMDERRIENAKAMRDELDYRKQEIEDDIVDDFKAASLADLTDAQRNELKEFDISDERYEKALERYFTE